MTQQEIEEEFREIEKEALLINDEEERNEYVKDAIWNLSERFRNSSERITNDHS